MSVSSSRRGVLAALIVLTGVALGLGMSTARAAGALEAQPGQALALGKVQDAVAAPLRATLAAARGKPVVLHFWGTWCEPCREEIPALSRYVQAQAGVPLAVVTVAVHDKPEDVDTFLWETDARLPVLYDRDQSLVRALGVYVMPTTLVLDVHHRVRWRSVGPLTWDDPAVRSTLAALLPAPSSKARTSARP